MILFQRDTWPGREPHNLRRRGQHPDDVRDSTSQGSGGHTPIDNLTYNYDSSNPNRLLSITDGTGSAYTNSGFRNRTGSTGNYTYDANGNLTADPYKGISSITYNAINRTFKLSFSASRYIYYMYDAGGQLIRKQQYDNVGGVATLIKTTDYIDGFVFEGNALQYFPMPEGRVIYSGGTFTREYIITDQQGNARISFNNTGTGDTVKVVQENSYYAYGLVMRGGTVTSGSNKKLYNGGREWQNDYANLPDYYQTFFRNYDAALGRWVAVDPIPESAIDISPYQYAANNPVMMNDPLGDKAQTEIDNSSSYYPWAPHQSIFGSNISPEMRLQGEMYAVMGGVGRAGGGGDYSAFWSGALGYLNDAIAALGANNGASVSNAMLAWGARQENAYSLGLVNSDGTPMGTTGFSGGQEDLFPFNVLSAGGDFYRGAMMHLTGNNLPLNEGKEKNKQYMNTCVFYSIAVAARYYGKKVDGLDLVYNFKINGKTITNDMANTLEAGGLSNDLRISAYKQYLKGYNSSDVRSAIADGNPVLGIFRPEGAAMNHQVLITGLGFNGSYTFYNTATDRYESQPSSVFIYTFVVTGAR